ncbi:pilus assembly protein PilC [Candidatus Velamenicoccus archaeovorus]|uniref:Pilus assembly protein PilC n=1 Tax=Velamenicoccus archaeovorus TaxID=1930593 RepID=A0A410P540_VELA1|nr:type II secretion system F family protein [Candidatus Velamenicoccus archaeovorus]QAT17240.1 pilus assembly protein PilC [Candidatus Velamenicoccus archaeovorus]
MALYSYVAKDSQGIRLTGILEAAGEQDAIATLHKRNLVVISVKEERVRKMVEKAVKLDDLVIFSRQLATMVESGITLVQALSILSEQAESKTLSDVTLKIKEDIESGSSLHEALNKHPKIFSNLYVNMVKAGEASGLLDEILDRLAGYLEKSSALQRKVKSSLVYPIVVISMAVLITIVLLVKVVPTFKGIFASLGGTLPLPTQVLILISDTLRHFFPFVVVGFVVFGFVFKKYIDTPRGRYQLDSSLLRMPLFGPLLRKVVVAKFSRTLSTLVRSGVPILNALEIVGKTAGNLVVEEAVMNARTSIKEGEPIADPLSKSGVFPPMVVRMISVGEQTGQLEKMLTKIADFYDEQVDAAVSGLTSMIEPVVIGFLGIVIGGIVIALFMPIFKITELIR